MTDEEFVFHETSRERKRNGVGTFHKKRQGGKYVRLPSDNMSRKEKNKMNGGVKVYNFAKPMSWNEFKMAPDDIKKEYIRTLIDKFHGVPSVMVAESFGVDKSIMAAYLSKHGIKFGRGKMVRCTPNKFLDTEDGEAWKKWVSGESVKVKGKPVELVAEEISDVDVVEHEEVEPVEVKPDVGNISKIAELLVGLVGTGAKVTIEFNL